MEDKTMSNKKDLTDSKALEHYCKMPEWTIDEAITLSLNKNPKEFVEERKRYPSNRYKEIRDLLIMSMRANEVHYTADRYGYDPTTIRPLDFIKWARNKDIPFPEELKILVNKYNNTGDVDWQAKCEELELENKELRLKCEELQKQPHHKRKKSIEQLCIGGLAVKYTPEKLQNNKVSYSKIRSDLELVGISLNDETIKSCIEDIIKHLD